MGVMSVSQMRLHSQFSFEPKTNSADYSEPCTTQFSATSDFASIRTLSQSSFLSKEPRPSLHPVLKSTTNPPPSSSLSVPKSLQSLPTPTVDVTQPGTHLQIG